MRVVHDVDWSGHQLKKKLSKAAECPQENRLRKGLSFVVEGLSTATKTVLEASYGIGCEVCQIVKSLIFDKTETGLPAVVIASVAKPR